MRSLPLSRSRRSRFFPPIGDEALLGLGEQGAFDLGQGLPLETLDGLFDPIEGIARPFEFVGPLGSGFDEVSVIVFEDEAYFGHIWARLLRLAAKQEAE
jgi:hypothetical protein